MKTAGRVAFDRGGHDYDEHLYATPSLSDHLDHLDDVGVTEVNRYHSSGYVAVYSALNHQQVSDALAALEDLARPGSPADIQYEGWAEERFDELSPAQRLDATRKFMRFSAHDQRLESVAQDPAILNVVRKFLGGAPQMFQDMALLKPPGGGREKPWHQDNAFFHMPPGTPIVGVWIALDEATVDNGCMRVIPGAHREGPIRHAFLRDLQVCDGEVPVDRGVAVPLPPGGLMIFDGLMLHGTPANRTATRRRALQFHYTVADAPRTSEDEHRATFGWVDGAEC